MGFNYEEISANLLRVIQNADNSQGFLADFFAGAAQDVEWSSVGADGSEVTRTVPNVTKFMSDIDGTVYRKLIQTIYVDPVNGDDNNTGSSVEPVKTCRAAFGKANVGGRLVVRLMGDVSINASEGMIYVTSQSVIFDSDTGDERTVTLNIDSAGIPIVLYVASLQFLKDVVKVKVRNIFDTEQRPGIYVSRGSYLRYEHDVDISDNARLCSIESGSSYLSLGGTSNAIGNNANLLHVVKTAELPIIIAAGTQINGAAADNTNIGTWIGGLVFDTDGKPRNVVSNIVL